MAAGQQKTHQQFPTIHPKQKLLEVSMSTLLGISVEKLGLWRKSPKSFKENPSTETLWGWLCLNVAAGKKTAPTISHNSPQTTTSGQIIQKESTHWNTLGVIMFKHGCWPTKNAPTISHKSPQTNTFWSNHLEKIHPQKHFGGGYV